MKMRIALAAAAIVTLAGCEQLGLQKQAAEAPPAAPAPVLPTEADIGALYDKLDAALKAKDAAAIAALYAPGGVMIDPMINAPAKSDPATAVAGITEWLKTEPTFTVNTAETQILDADTVVVSGVVTNDFKRNGRPTWVVQRYTDVWQKQADGQWLIVTSHVSNAPQPVRERPAPMTPAAAPAPDTPLGGATPAPAAPPAPEKK
jgi:uncharacterized protein (TIGR02246 family)